MSSGKPLSKKACDRCRQRKVKCDLAESNNNSCGNCRLTGVPCASTFPAKQRGPKPRLARPNMPSKSQNSPLDGALIEESASRQTSDNSEIHVEFPTWDHGDPRNCETTPIAAQSPLSHSSISYMPSIQPTPLPLPYEIYHELIADLARVVPSFTFDTIATKCIDLYFEYLFPLIPIVHGPDLREGLNIWVNYAQQAERPNAGIWPAPPSILESMGTSHGRNEQHYVASLFTLVTALCAESASMVPVQFFPEGPLISNTFLHASRKALQEYLEADIDQPNSRSLATRYFHSNCLHAAGKQRLSWHIFGEAARLAQVMKLNEESSYDGLDPIEAQLRKRAFWILYMGDKSAAILNDRPITLHKFSFESGITASYADEVGNYAGQMMQSPSSPNPPGRSLITGFNFNLRLWQAASDLLLEIRLMNDAGYNQGVGKLSISEQRSHISNFYIHFMTCLDELPPWLQIDLTAFTTKENSTAYSREFLIQQVNLRVSFHCLKMVIIKKFEDAGFSTSGIGLEHSKTLALTKTEIARDMVRAMQEAPFWALQVNGESCVEKIRIIGASLLKVIHNNRDSPIEVRARVEFVVLLDILTRLDSKASDGLRDGSF